MSVATVTTTAYIDIGPDGISISFQGIDEDLAKLIKSANNFTSQAPVSRSLGTADLLIKSDRVIDFVAPPPAPPVTP